MNSYYWYVIRFTGKIAFLLCATKFLTPELFIDLQTFIIISETVIVLSSSTTVIFQSKNKASGNQNFFWTINLVEITIAVTLTTLLLILKDHFIFTQQVNWLLLPFILASLLSNLHYRHIIIDQSNLISSQKFLIVNEVVPYTGAALLMAFTQSFEDGILFIIVWITISTLFWARPGYEIKKKGIQTYLRFLRGMFFYSLIGIGYKTFEKLIAIQKFNTDVELAAFLFFAKVWSLIAMLLIGYRGAIIRSSLSKFIHVQFIKTEIIKLVSISLALTITVFIASMALPLTNAVQFKSLTDGITSQTFICTGLYSISLALYSTSVMIAEIRCSKRLIYTQATGVFLGLVIVTYFSNFLSYYLSVLTLLLLSAAVYLFLKVMKSYD
jgi:hypothetical protein